MADETHVDILNEDEGEVAIPVHQESEVETPVEEAKPFKTFASEEEYQAWRTQELASLQTRETTPKETPTEAAQRIFEEGWQPKDWNDFAENLLKNPAALARLRDKMVPETAQAIQEMSVKERQELEDINKGFDAEYTTLSKEGKLPPLSSEEGQKINQQISLIGAAYNQTSITKAYDLWSKIPQSKGGGLEYVPPAKQKLNAQKQRSGIVSSSRGASGTAKKTMSYDKVHSRSLDDLMDEDL